MNKCNRCRYKPYRPIKGIWHDVWRDVRPFLVEAIAHIAIFCLAFMQILSILILSVLILAISERIFHEVPFIIKIFIYISDVIMLYRSLVVNPKKTTLSG